jgi:hypothetical protein
VPLEFADSASTVVAYQRESFSVFLDKVEFKTRMGSSLNGRELFTGAQASAYDQWPENDTPT